MPQVTFPLTNFQTPDGNPVSFGTVWVRLSTNGNASGNQLWNTVVQLTLDTSGNFLGSTLFWTNGSILPAGTYYIVQVFSQTGQLVYGPAKLII